MKNQKYQINPRKLIDEDFQLLTFNEQFYGLQTVDPLIEVKIQKNEIDDLKTENYNLNQLVTQLTAEQDVQQETITHFQAKFNDFSHQLSEKNQQILSQEIQQTKEISALKTQISMLQAENAHNKRNLSNQDLLQNKLFLSLKDNQNSQKLILEQQSELEKLKRENSQLIAENQSFQSKIDFFEAENSSFQQQRDEKIEKIKNGLKQFYDAARK